ncbi:MAG: hypothetical protein WC217_03825 [Candidatus Paceibacterota bacterium]|jgi:hypothetical protein
MNIFGTLTALIRRLRTGTSQDPVRDWLVVSIFSAIVFTGIVVWNIWAFDTVANGGVIGAPVPETKSVFDQSSLDTIRTIFENRAVEEAKYMTGVYRYADPSQ